MRKEFIEAYNSLDPAKPAPWESYTSEISSTARIENYSFLSPAPGLAPYEGHRRLGNIDAVKYEVKNIEYDAAFEVLLRDIEDDQVGGYQLKPREMAAKARLFPGRLALQHLAQGKSKLCFDGTPFFADSHAIGVGDNLMSKNCASNDSVICNVVAMLHTGPIKPLIYQRRKEPRFMDDYGEKSSFFAKKVRYWVDMECGIGFGFWHDAILMEIEDTPNVTEVQEVISAIQQRFRTFQLPKAMASDQTEYVHEQTEFNAATCTFVVSPNLENLFRAVLESETIVNGGAAVTNIYRGQGRVTVSNHLNTVS